MACNMASSSLLSTGAFEVYFNDTLVFSKIDTGLVPDANYLIERFKNFQTSDQIGEY
jgi:selT/selW/selH-like putative selenoprotein